MPKIDLTKVPERKGTGYPAEFAAPCAERGVMTGVARARAEAVECARR